MKLNDECIRDIMKYLVDYLEWSIDSEGQIIYNSINTQMIANSLEKYNVITICQSIHILAEQDFIRGDKLFDMKYQYPGSITINEITYLGHNFYNSIQDDTTWSKTKSIIGKIGNHSLHFVEDTAQLVAKEAAKQAVAIAMTK